MIARTWGGMLAVGLVLLAGCRDQAERNMASETLLGLEADQVLVGVEMTLTREGVRRGLLEADTAFSYQEEGRLRLTNPNITFLDESGIEQGQLRGHEGEYDFESGDVHVRSGARWVGGCVAPGLSTEAGAWVEGEFRVRPPASS